MNIDWWTLGLQAINFLVLMAILRRFLYRPVSRLVERRQAEIAEKYAAAETAASDAEELRRERESNLAAFAEEREEILEEDREERERERLSVIEAARAEARSLMDAVRRQLDEEREEAFEAVREDVTDLAIELAKCLLHDTRFESIIDPFIERTVDYLRSMPEPERNRLLKHVTADNPVRIVTAPELDEEQQARCRTRLGGLIGPHLAFAHDESLIAGIELRFPRGIIRLSWSETLKAVRGKLGSRADAA